MQSYQSWATRLAAACAISLGGYVGLFIPIPLVPIYARELGASYLEIGLIFSAKSAAAILVAVPMGLYSDRVDRKKIIFLGLLVMAASAYGLSTSGNLSQIILFFVLFGAGISAFETSISAHVGDIVRMNRIGLTFGAFAASIQGGMGLAALTGTFVASRWSFQHSFALTALVLFPTSVASLLLKAVKKERSAEGPRWSGARDLVGSKRVLAGWTGMFFTFLVYGGVLTFLPVYARTVGLDLITIGAVITVQSLANVLFRPLIGLSADRLKRRTFLMTLGTVLVSASTMLISSASEVYGLVAVVVSLALGMSLVVPLASGLVAEGSVMRNRGLAMGVMMTIQYSTLALGSGLMGFLSSDYGFTVGFEVLASLGLLEALVVYAVTRRP